MSTAFLNDGITVIPGTDPGSIIIARPSPPDSLTITADGLATLLTWLREGDLMPEDEEPELVVQGDPIDGFTFVGPFYSDSAQEWADSKRDSDHWVATMEKP